MDAYKQQQLQLVAVTTGGSYNWWQLQLVAVTTGGSYNRWQLLSHNSEAHQS